MTPLNSFYNSLLLYSQLATARSPSWDSQRYHMFFTIVWTWRWKLRVGKAYFQYGVVGEKDKRVDEKRQEAIQKAFLALGCGWRCTFRHSQTQIPTQTPIHIPTHHLKFFPASFLLSPPPTTCLEYCCKFIRHLKHENEKWLCLFIHWHINLFI